MEIPNNELANRVILELGRMTFGLGGRESKATCARAAKSLSRILGINRGRGKVGNEELIKELKKQHPEVAAPLKSKLCKSSELP